MVQLTRPSAPPRAANFATRAAAFGRRGRAWLSLVPGMVGASPVLAHHAMDGVTPGSAVEGLLSGFAHPVIGADHFCFLLTVGMLLAFCPLRARLQAVAALAGGLLLGVVAAVNGLDFPLANLFCILTLIGTGLLALATRSVGTRPLVAVVGVAALFHGLAFAAAIVGSEASPLIAYLIGLSITGGVIVLGVGILASTLATGFGRDFPRAARRWTGFAALIIGNLLLLSIGTL
ncbi:MAG: HupE/UreJ family protein [Rhodocyclaceae bacterium]|nr:HupE/UreJ family protein [Rhodocyclaceae bacterium]